MTRRWEFLAAAIVLSVLFLPLVAPPARGANASIGPINDPTVDVKTGVPSWQDIVSDSISGGGATSFTFVLTMAGSIPSSPSMPKDTVELLWWFCFQMNGSFSATGWPFNNGNGLGCQYFAFLLWDGTNFAAVEVNRTPEANGGDPTLAVIPYTTQSANITWTVNPALLGFPSSFGYWVASEDRGSGAFQITSPTQVAFAAGNKGFQILDIDTGPGGSLVPWP